MPKGVNTNPQTIKQSNNQTAVAPFRPEAGQILNSCSVRTGVVFYSLSSTNIMLLKELDLYPRFSLYPFPVSMLYALCSMLHAPCSPLIAHRSLPSGGMAAFQMAAVYGRGLGTIPFSTDIRLLRSRHGLSNDKQQTTNNQTRLHSIPLSSLVSAGRQSNKKSLYGKRFTWIFFTSS